MARQQSLNDRLATQVLLRASEVERLTGRLQQRALRELIRLDTVLVGMIQQVGPAKPLRSTLKQAREVIKEYATAAQLVALVENEAIILAEAKAMAGAVNVAVGAPLATAPSSSAFVEATKSRALVMGAPAQEWWSRQSTRTFQRFSDIVRGGVLLGRDTPTLVREWRDASAQLKRHAETHVRTSVQSVSNAARVETFQRNRDVIKGYQAVATLDLRTSEICRNRDGQVWAVDDPQFPGPPPWHWNCRSTLIPVLREFDALSDANKGKVPPAMRSSMNGQVPRNMTYYEWLDTLPKGDQLQVLGKTEWQKRYGA